MIKCSICFNNINENNIIKVKEMMLGTKKDFYYSYCDYCNSLSLLNIPENIERFYHNYYVDKKKFIEISRVRKNLWNFRRVLYGTIFHQLIRYFFNNDILNWAYYSKIKKNSRILDVGCGNGYVLNEFSKHGFTNLYGIDPYFAIEKYNHIHLINEDFLNYNFDINFDLIMFHHSFEHMINQEEVFHKAISLLNKNGKILIRMPVVNKAYEIYRENWVQIDAPRHITLHSEKSINIFCNRFGCKIYYSYYDSTEFQFLGSEQFKNNIPTFSENSYRINPQKSIFKIEDYKRYRDLAEEFNKQRKGDQAVFFIVKC